VKVIILAAGIGSRLNASVPKPLIVLRNGKTILENQLDNLLHYCSVHDIVVVVGFKKELIMESFPTLTYVYNHLFGSSNTGKSLLCALEKIRNEDVLWLNGDVVFDYRIIGRMLAQKKSCMAVNRTVVGEEEVKYTLDEQGSIREVSKNVREGAVGEAIGINVVQAEDSSLLRECLRACAQNDYFERGIEMAIQRGLRIWPVDISDLNCVEVDFEEDLSRANSFLADDAQSALGLNASIGPTNRCSERGISTQQVERAYV
jgi:choline kinase